MAPQESFHLVRVTSFPCHIWVNTAMRSLSLRVTRRWCLMRSISNDASVSMVTGDLVATRLLPGTAANGSITANKLVLEYDSGLPEPSQITSTIGTDQTGTTVFSNGVQVGANSTAQLTAGVVAFTGLAVQATGMPSSFSTLSRADCTDPINPCSLTLTGSGPGVYALGINLPNIGNAIPEVRQRIFVQEKRSVRYHSCVYLCTHSNHLPLRQSNTRCT